MSSTATANGVDNTNLEHELQDSPQDGITQVVFAHQSNYLIASSWDKTVRLYEAERNQALSKHEHKSAVLSCCFNTDDSQAFTGALDGTLTQINLSTHNMSTLGQHNQAIRCVSFATSHNLVISGSWDRTIQLWDYRSHSSSHSHSCSVAQHETAGKIYTMDLSPAQLQPQRLVVGTSDRHVYIYDLRNMNKPEQIRESSLMHQTRCVRASPDGQGYALSSIEGRVAIEYFDASTEIQNKKYAFKCHRATLKGLQTIYPVNALAYHPKFGTFASGGCDGFINIWDGDNKKRICQYPAYPTSIASLHFNHSGNLLAIAASYTFEEGEKEHPRDCIFIRRILDKEVRPKAKVASASS